MGGSRAALAHFLRGLWVTELPDSRGLGTEPVCVSLLGSQVHLCSSNSRLLWGAQTCPENRAEVGSGGGNWHPDLRAVELWKVARFPI